MSGNFFKDVFGFEEAEYAETQRLLQEMSRFEPATEASMGLGRPWTEQRAEQIESYKDLEVTAADSPLKRTSSMSLAESECGDVVVGERCVFEVPTDDDAQVKCVDAGVFSAPSVKELRQRVTRLVESLSEFERAELSRVALTSFGVEAAAVPAAPLFKFSNTCGDSRSLHSDIENANSVMQAASQFNFLEFPSPGVTPERGISGYVFDRTQGPACAIACAAGTAYRNYLAKVTRNSPRGQTKEVQFDGLLDVTKCLVGEVDQATPNGNNETPPMYYKVKNGYVDSSAKLLLNLNMRLAAEPTMAEEKLIPLLRIGVQEDTQVTDEAAGCLRKRITTDDGRVKWVLEKVPDMYPVKVTQVYCSALSVGYSSLPGELWEAFARCVLCATYEATLLVSVIHTIKLLRNGRLCHKLLHPITKVPPVLPRTMLTKVGGGVFANAQNWIQDAMLRAVRQVAKYGVPLDVHIVHYGNVETGYDRMPKLLQEAASGKEHSQKL